MDPQSHAPDLEPEPIEKIILRSMNEGVITVECNGTIASANRAALKMLGLDRAEVVGLNVGQAFAGDGANSEFVHLLEELTEGRTTPLEEVLYCRADGQKAHLSVTTSFLDLLECRPGMDNADVVYRDVTAIKSLERVKKRAVSHLSHELETPLAIISASVDRLFRGDLGEEAARKNYDRISRNLKRLQDIQFAVKQIVDPPPPNPRPLDPVELATQTVSALRQETSHRDVPLVLEVPPIGTVSMDPEILAFSIRALVKNAVENSPDGNPVRITLARVRDGLELTVEDSGVGVTLMDQEFIFDGLHHTQRTEEYASRRPFDFDAGGKGLELLRIKGWSEAGLLRISFESERCRHIPAGVEHCRSATSPCSLSGGSQGCQESGGSRFTLIFHLNDQQIGPGKEAG